MAVISVTTTAQLIPEAWRDIQNLGTADVYIGNDSSVSSSNGVRIVPGGVYNRPYRPAYPVWIIAGTGTQDVRAIA